MSREYVKVDFSHHNPKFQYFKDGTLVKKWSIKKAQSVDMICSIIDNQDMNKFDANRMKNMVIYGLEKLQPKTVKIVKKEPNE